jgi:hypothetical protein
MATEICPSCGRSRRVGEGVAAEDSGMHTPETPESVPLRGAGASALDGRHVVALMTAVIGLCQILTITGPAGKLKKLKN